MATAAPKPRPRHTHTRRARKVVFVQVKTAAAAAAPQPFVLLDATSRRGAMLADPAKVKEPMTTTNLAEAVTYPDQSGAIKKLQRNPVLRGRFKIARAK